MLLLLLATTAAQPLVFRGATGYNAGPPPDSLLGDAKTTDATHMLHDYYSLDPAIERTNVTFAEFAASEGSYFVAHTRHSEATRRGIEQVWAAAHRLGGGAGAFFG
jgi:hypothetical protein